MFVPSREIVRYVLIWKRKGGPYAAHASASFFDAWDTYQKVVTCDYMFHREIGEALNQLLRAHSAAAVFHP